MIFVNKKTGNVRNVDTEVVDINGDTIGYVDIYGEIKKINKKLNL